MDATELDSWHVATLSRPLHHGFVQCLACEHWCALAPGAAGKCGVRRNLRGALHLLVYGRAIAVHVDPVEKKPLHHFLPGSDILSLGTYGCNLSCAWCQNWEIAQHKHFDATEYLGDAWPPERVVATCKQQHIPLIALTYNEPAVYIEYALDIARLAKTNGLHTVLVSSGFETIKALDQLAPYVDAVNVDLKAFSDATYRHYCGARLNPVLRNIRHLVTATPIWTEVTTLVIPGINDSNAELSAIAAFLADVSLDLPWHVSAFAPNYQMRDRPATPATTLRHAWEIGRRAGLRYVYTGNIWHANCLAGCSDTCCPQCGATVIQRSGYRVQPLWQTPGICAACGTMLAGRWR